MTLGFWWFFLLTVVLRILAGCGEQEVSYPQRVPPEDFLVQVSNQRAGADLFAQKCVGCHGHPSEGRNPRADFFSPPAPDFTAREYQQKDPAYLFWRISKGKTVEPFLSRGSVMPAWGRYFSDREIWQLVAYLRSRPPSAD